MVFLLLVIVTSASFNIFFKIFERVGVNTSQAIVVNYVVATTASLMMTPLEYLYPRYMINEGWFYGGILMGIIFCLTFYLYDISTRNFGISLTTLMTRISLILPTLVSYFFLGENLSLSGWVAIPLIIIAIYLLVKQGNSNRFIVNTKGKWYIAALPFIVFIGCGCADTLMKLIHYSYVDNVNENNAYTFVMYVSSLITSYISYRKMRESGKDTLSYKTVIWGTVMGVFNTINVYSILRALDSIPATIAYPTINMGIVLLSVIVGFFAFKEKITLMRGAGIVLAIIAIYLLSSVS